MTNLEERVAAIEARNIKVEADKAWETSGTRKILIMLLTYLVISVYLGWVRNDAHWWLDAVVPTLGFYLSTLVLRLAKSRWVANWRAE